MGLEEYRTVERYIVKAIRSMCLAYTGIIHVKVVKINHYLKRFEKPRKSDLQKYSYSVIKKYNCLRYVQPRSHIFSDQIM